MPAPRATVKTPSPALPADVQLRERTYQELKRRLLSGEWASEPMLSQRHLARLLGTSLTPVRSAVERLEAEGLVRIEPRRGVMLRQLDAREVAELYEFRVAIESYVLEQVAGRVAGGQVSVAQLSELERLMERQRAAVSRGDVPGTVEADAAFHQALCAATGNREIVAAMDRLRDRVCRVILQVVSAYPVRMAESVTEHEQILQAVVAGDGRLAAARLREHLGRGRELMASASMNRAASPGGDPPVHRLGEGGLR
ncbi:MAG: GntR family transcriptional regulator [Tepidisphaerales bacterium]